VSAPTPRSIKGRHSWRAELARSPPAQNAAKASSTCGRPREAAPRNTYRYPARSWCRKQNSELHNEEPQQISVRRGQRSRRTSSARSSPGRLSRPLLRSPPERRSPNLAFSSLLRESMPLHRSLLDRRSTPVRRSSVIALPHRPMARSPSSLRFRIASIILQPFVRRPTRLPRSPFASEGQIATRPLMIRWQRRYDGAWQSILQLPLWQLFG
jgi:hypothetical protein